MRRDLSAHRWIPLDFASARCDAARDALATIERFDAIERFDVARRVRRARASRRAKMARLDANVGDSTRGAKSEERRAAKSVERRAKSGGRARADDYKTKLQDD